jgi:hypothetical protein
VNDEEHDVFEGLDLHEVEDEDLPEYEDYLREDWEPDPIDASMFLGMLCQCHFQLTGDSSR